MKKERKVGIEILRILSMYMVLILHYKLHQNVSSLTDINYKIANFVDILCVCAVNCYVLISGYFLSKGETSIKKLIKTLSPVWFYSITILIVNLLLTEDVIKYNNLLKFIFPVTLGEYWFVLSYTLLYLLTPFLKKVIDNSERKELKSLIIILLFFSFLSNFLGNSNINSNIIDKTRGYGIIWLTTLFICAGYIRKYKLENKIPKKFLLLSYICSSILVYISFLSIKYLNDNNILIHSIKFKATLLSDYNSINIFINSICLFLLFLQIDIKNKFIKKIILFISPLTFGVYIIHCNPLIFKKIYVELLQIQKYTTSSNYLIIMLLKCALLFIVCILIEKLRQLIFKLIGLIIKKIQSKLKK